MTMLVRPKTPTKPEPYQNGAFDPVPHDQRIVKTVLSVDVPADDSLTASITAGASTFTVDGLTASDWILVDISDELPPNHHGPAFDWEQNQTAHSDGTTPLPVRARQRVDVIVAALVPYHTLPPGAFTGTLVVRGKSFAQAVPLRGTYLAVDETSPIGQRWRQLGGEARFGQVRSLPHAAPDGRGTIQEFAKGVLYQAPGLGVYYLSPAIYAKWISPDISAAKTAGGQIVRDVLGFPIDDTFATPEHGEAIHFQAGAIVVRAGGAAWVVYGAIYADYARLGSLADANRQPPLGLPSGDEAPTAAGRLQSFDRGDIFWTLPTGAHEIHGAIRQHWYDLGGAGSQGFLGLPLTDETGTPDGVGRFNRFENGMIYWTPATEAHEVHGAILDRWSHLGFERSYLGYPTADEGPWTNPANGRTGRISTFQNGQIGWTAQDGPIELPQTISLHEQVLTPSGTALGGWVEVSLASTGSYTFTGHMHDSGFDSYAFRVRAVARSGSGAIALALQHSGHTGGTTGGGSRDDDWHESGSDPRIRANWTDIRAATLSVSKSYEDTGALGTVEEIVKDVLGFLVLDVLVGAELALVVALGSELAAVTKTSVAGPGGLLGLAVAAGVVWVWGPGAWVPAVVAGVAAGAVTDALIKHRPLSADESTVARRVFGDTLPPDSRIVLTNLAGLQGRAFTTPNVDGTILVNLGDGFDHPNPLAYSQPPCHAYPKPGQMLIHELTHVWQIAHATFLPGLICQGIANQAGKVLGGDPYRYGPAGPPWSAFNLEQQGAIVDQYYQRHTDDKNGLTDDVHDSYYGYIANNIRLGAT